MSSSSTYKKRDWIEEVDWSKWDCERDSSHFVLSLSLSFTLFLEFLWGIERKSDWKNERINKWAKSLYQTTCIFLCSIVVSKKWIIQNPNSHSKQFYVRFISFMLKNPSQNFKSSLFFLYHPVIWKRDKILSGDGCRGILEKEVHCLCDPFNNCVIMVAKEEG